MLEDSIEARYAENHPEDELDRLGLPIAPEPKFLEIRQLQNHVATAGIIEARVRSLRTDCDGEIAKLDPHLRPEILAQRERDIRARYQNDIDAEFKKAGELIDDANSTTPLWTREAVLARSRFDPTPDKDATQRATWIMRLGKSSPNNLIEFSRRAALEGNLALASAIYEELDSRGDAVDKKVRAQVKVILNRIPSDADKAAPLLRSLDQLGGRLRVAAGAQGFERIKVGLASERVPYQPDDDDDDAPPLSGGAARIAQGLRKREEAAE